MFSAFEWMMAMRYLRARRREGFISVIAWFSLAGIALGVATLIIVMAVMNGFRQELLSRILGLNGHLSVFSAQGRTIGDFDKVAEKIRGVDGVAAVVPIVEGQVMISRRGFAQGALVRGIRSKDLVEKKIVSDNIVAGDLAGFAGDNAVVLGARLAEKMRAGVGDVVTLISPNVNVTAFGSVPRMRAYRVVATFRIGMYEYDSGFVYMPMAAAQVYFQTPGAVTNIEVAVDNPDRARAVGLTIVGTGDGRIQVRDWQAANASFFNAIRVERNVMFLILALIVLVAAFNIVSTLIMLVRDKGRDIAVLRAMGATRGGVMRIFLIAGTGVGAVGTLAGVVLGLVFCDNIESIRRGVESLTGNDLFAPEIYFLSQLPAEVNPMEVAAVALMSLSLSFLATVYPSWRAARIDPAEALRYE